MTGRDHAEVFVRALQPDPSPQTVTRFVAMRKRTQPVAVWRWSEPSGALDTVLAMNGRGFDVYMQVNPCKTTSSDDGGTRENVAYVNTIPMDLDLYAKPNYEPQAVFDYFERIGLKLGAGVWSGGGAHLYLFLDRPYSIAEAELVAKRVALVSGGDMVYSANRIMRLPGTVNWKDPASLCYLVGLRPECRHSLESITAALDAEGWPQVEDPAAPMPETSLLPAPPAELSELIAAAPDDVRAAITTGVLPGGRYDRSAYDHRIACALIRAGATDQQIADVYEAYPIRSFIAGKRTAYLERTIANARREVLTSLAALQPDLAWVAGSAGVWFVDDGRIRFDREKARELLRRFDQLQASERFFESHSGPQ